MYLYLNSISLLHDTRYMFLCKCERLKTFFQVVHAHVPRVLVLPKPKPNLAIRLRLYRHLTTHPPISDIMPRLNHTKTRNGCQRCKARKVKVRSAPP